MFLYLIPFLHVATFEDAILGVEQEYATRLAHIVQHQLQPRQTVSQSYHVVNINGCDNCTYLAAQLYLIQAAPSSQRPILDPHPLLMSIAHYQPPSSLPSHRPFTNLILLWSILPRTRPTLPLLPPLGWQSHVRLLLLSHRRVNSSPGSLTLVLERLEQLVSWVGDDIE